MESVRIPLNDRVLFIKILIVLSESERYTSVDYVIVADIIEMFGENLRNHFFLKTVRNSTF